LVFSAYRFQLAETIAHARNDKIRAVLGIETCFAQGI